MARAPIRSSSRRAGRRRSGAESAWVSWRATVAEPARTRASPASSATRDSGSVRAGIRMAGTSSSSTRPRARTAADVRAGVEQGAGQCGDGRGRAQHAERRGRCPADHGVRVLERLDGQCRAVPVAGPRGQLDGERSIGGIRVARVGVGQEPEAFGRRSLEEPEQLDALAGACPAQGRPGQGGVALRGRRHLADRGLPDARIRLGQGPVSCPPSAVEPGPKVSRAEARTSGSGSSMARRSPVSRASGSARAKMRIAAARTATDESPVSACSAAWIAASSPDSPSAELEHAAADQARRVLEERHKGRERGPPAQPPGDADGLGPVVGGPGGHELGQVRP